MSQDIKDIIREVVGEFDLKSMIEGLEPTDEEREILARALAGYASLKIKEQMGQDVERDLKMTEATLVNLSFMNEAKVRGILAPFLSVGGGLVYTLINRSLDILFEKIYEELISGEAGGEAATS